MATGAKYRKVWQMPSGQLVVDVSHAFGEMCYLVPCAEIDSRLSETDSTVDRMAERTKLLEAEHEAAAAQADLGASNEMLDANRKEVSKLERVVRKMLDERSLLRGELMACVCSARAVAAKEVQASADYLGERLKQVKSDYQTLWRRVVQASGVGSSENCPLDRAIHEVEHWADERSQLRGEIEKRAATANRIECEFNEYLKSLAESVGVDMGEFAKPSSHGNDRLRWAVLISQKMKMDKLEDAAHQSDKRERLREGIMRVDQEAWLTTLKSGEYIARVINDSHYDADNPDWYWRVLRENAGGLAADRSEAIAAAEDWLIDRAIEA